MGQAAKSTSNDVVARIKTYNAGRDPERLALKYARMAESPLRFLRGTCHLFWEDWPRKHPLDNAPLGWDCGDLHLENLGAFRGENGLVYFDLNDFDEAARAPITRDPVRFATSLLVSSSGSGKAEAARMNDLADRFLDCWGQALLAGKAMWVERETSSGPVRDLLDKAASRSRRSLLDNRTKKGKDGRQLTIDGKRALEASKSQIEQAKAILKVAVGEDHTQAFKLLFLARRIAGTGSLGVERYIALVEGDGKPDGHWLIDIKEAVESSLAPSVAEAQPKWASEAERVVSVQNRMQAACPAWLRPVKLGRKSYVLRELQPSDLKLDLSKPTDMKQVLPVMGETLGSAQLRASGRGGAATADEMIEFAQGKRWKKQILDYAIDYSPRVIDDYHTFLEAWKDGDFKP